MCRRGHFAPPPVLPTESLPVKKATTNPDRVIGAGLYPVAVASEEVSVAKLADLKLGMLPQST